MDAMVALPLLFELPVLRLAWRVEALPEGWRTAFRDRLAGG
jgi:hypothetical protein